MSDEANLETSAKEVSTVAVSPELKHIVEALLFASDEPVSLQTLRVVFDDVNREAPEGEKIGATNEEFKTAVASLNAEYEESHRAYRIKQLAGGYVFATENEFAGWVGKLFKEKARRKLSQTAVESLAIIAYKQPITKSEVEFIRGVNCDYIMKTLLEKNLVTIVGRAHSPGRPLLYGTTADFLKHFGLNEISDLPKPREIEELIGETELEVEKRMLADQQEIEFKEKLVEKLDPNSRAPHIPRKKSKLQEPPQEGESKTVIAKERPSLPESAPAPDMPAEHIDSAEIISVVPHTEESSMPPAPVEEIVEASVAVIPVHPAEVVTDEPVEEVTSQREDVLPGILVEEVIVAEPSRIETVEDVHSVEAAEPEPIHQPQTARTSSEEEFQSEDRDPKKGWSKWKTKIQTFFRTLFG